MKHESKLRAEPSGRFFGVMIGIAVAVIAGLGLWYSRAGEALEHLSYDLPFAFAKEGTLDDILLVQMDDPSYEVLNQKWLQLWDRSLHARLLRKLKDCKLVVFDVWLAEDGIPAADRDLAEAIRDHGNVVLGAKLEPLAHPGFPGLTTMRPRKIFLDAAQGRCGVGEVLKDSDKVIRKQFGGTDFDPSLAWAAAMSADAPGAANAAERQKDRWIRYYGPARTLPTISYYLALEKPADFFRGKIVFVGGKPRTRTVGEEVDEFASPYTRWSGEGISGLELQATMFLNLWRGEWLIRMPAWAEVLLMVFGGIVFGYSMVVLRPSAAFALGVAAALAVGMTALWLFWDERIWFSWMLISGVQIPCAWVWSLVYHQHQLQAQSDQVLQSRRRTAPMGANRAELTPSIIPSDAKNEPSTAPTTKAPPGAAAPAGATAAKSGFRSPPIPDHLILRQTPIGGGSYGDVWLASNVMGSYRAIKVIYRDRFREEHSYLREFIGIKKYEPISRSHEGLVDILHVGGNAAEGYFYYIMELADDQELGQDIAPDCYVPKTLGNELKRSGKFDFPEALQLSLALSSALHFIHQQQLIHRDIKPSNIIFVKGVPKIADIGLVTDLRGASDATYIGTKGYIAPEGPGTASADVYSLGKVLFQTSLAPAAERGLAIPRSHDGGFEDARLTRLRQIIDKACEEDPAKRYQTAAQLRDDLLTLQAGISPRASLEL